ncbi:MAG: glucuronate isomerase [Oscillospiraceae bacterium]|nr:glucuronate isomerase [Oscillospiraceae bacterium]
MKKFMCEDFLLSTNTAKELFSACKGEPIFDWHCHLPPKEIYENKTPRDITELWLAADHYKWRAMRSCGVNEEYITGSASPYEKFKAWAKCMPKLIGNPLYHWTHLELQRYFGIFTPLSEKTADEIWEKTNSMIAAGGFTPRELIEKSNVECVCTTDDPADTLEFHELIKNDPSFKTKVLPAFRPDKALGIDAPTFLPWLNSLESVYGKKINSFAELKAALVSRIEHFEKMGCRATDHAFNPVPYKKMSNSELENVFAKALKNEALTPDEAEGYKTELLRFLAAEYHKRGWAMELHIGATRNNNTKMFDLLGPDSGFDSIGDDSIANKLSCLLDSINSENCLPKTILFTLNPKDNQVLGAMTGNFQTDEAASKIQFGTAWWFNDNIDGMRAQIAALANTGVLANFIGMVTDSRSFLSYPRHEYFRRILCEYIGNLVENGEYPYDIDVLSQTVKDISFGNAKNYFGI